MANVLFAYVFFGDKITITQNRRKCEKKEKKVWTVEFERLYSASNLNHHMSKTLVPKIGLLVIAEIVMVLCIDPAFRQNYGLLFALFFVPLFIFIHLTTSPHGEPTSSTPESGENEIPATGWTIRSIR